MLFTPIVLFICFLVFLFTLHSLVREDFVILRRNVSLEQVFNLAFLTGSVALFASRLFYVAFHFRPGYINPLVFFLFTHFPGLSLPGALLGGVVFLIFYGRYKKLPLHRLLDVFALSALSCLPIGLLIIYSAALLTQTLHQAFVLLVPVIYGVLLVFILRFFKKGRLHDGSMSMVIIFLVSCITILSDILIGQDRFIFVFTKQDVLLIVCAFGAVFYLMWLEKLFGKRRVVK